MKKLVAAVLVSTLGFGSVAYAGGLQPIVEEEEVIVNKPASSISPLLILGLIVLIGIAVSQNNDNQDT